MIKKYLKSIVALTLICAIVTALMAVTNYFTAPTIAENESAAANAALLVVFPDGEGFEAIDISQYELPDSITGAYSEKNGGYVFQMEVTGYSSGMVIMCGINAEGNVVGATCLSSGETLGEEKTYGDKVIGTNLDTIGDVATVAGATKTTMGYKTAVKDALNAFVILSGGSVDLRGEDEKIVDALNTALPQAEGKFSKWFMVEKLSGVSAVYVASNNTGFVFVIGESFVATDKAGKVISSATEDEKKIAENSAKIVAESTKEEIDLTKYENMPNNILKAYKTNSGNYLFELRASGYGKWGDSYGQPSGEYIYITASVTADGEIIACETTSQKESDGIGSECANPDFYSQFNGKTEKDYTEIDAIGGATVTTDGYKRAIGKIFVALNILKGDA